MRQFCSAGVCLPVIGQGTWMFGEEALHARVELRALCPGIELSMTHIDTAEMYGGGGAEGLVSNAIDGKRDRVFLVSLPPLEMI
jgi:diketogulonate reductase-like aldo/keto reductase